jgi:hypothetical protein
MRIHEAWDHEFSVSIDHLRTRWNREGPGRGYKGRNAASLDNDGLVWDHAPRDRVKHGGALDHDRRHIFSEDKLQHKTTEREMNDQIPHWQ